MSQDQTAGPADAGFDDPGSPAVVEWGDEGGRPGRVGRGLAALRGDPRLAPVVAVLAALALAGSLFSEWRVWTVEDAAEDGSGGIGPLRFASGLVSLPNMGGAYLIGVLLLCASVTLALFGTRPARHNARLVGLAVAGVMIAVLAAATSYFDELGDIYQDLALQGAIENLPGATSTVVYGRGIYLAFAGVLAMALALWLAKPSGPRPGGRDPRRAGPVAGPDGDGEPSADREQEVTRWDGGGWRWPSRSAKRPPGELSSPPDLTVEPATPFLPPARDDQAR